MKSCCCDGNRAILLLLMLCIGGLAAANAAAADGNGDGGGGAIKSSRLRAARPSAANCTTHYFVQDIDHFNWAPPLGSPTYTTFQQRYFVCDEHLHGNAPKAVFFYFGNEDDVTLYVNNTGLMWENAEDFQALLIFAEHR